MQGSVLVVEDETLVAMDLKMRLGALGLDVVGLARSYEEAIALCETKQPDVALMDVQLVGPIDGIDTAREIRRRFGVPSVFLTAFSDGDSIARAKQTEAYGYLLKPFQERELAITLEFALFKRSSERDSERQRALLRATMDSLVEAVVVCDNSGSIALMNGAAAQMTGVSAEAALGRPFANVVSWRQPRATELTELAGFPGDLRLLAVNDRSEIPVEVSSRSIDAGALLAGGTVHTFRDVSQLREARGRALVAEEAKREFLARLTHEMRTPLNNIVGMSALIATVAGESARPYIALLDRGAQSMGTMIDDLLEYASLGDGVRTYESERFQPGPTVERVALTYAAEAQAAGLRYEIRIDPMMPKEVQGVRVALERSLRSLLSNAIKFTEEGQVTLSALVRADGGETRLEVEVEDTGPGISPPFRERLFAGFEQWEHYSTRKSGGMGLGLALARRILAANGGDLVYSEGRDGGSRFNISLPVMVNGPDRRWYQTFLSSPAELIDRIVVTDPETAQTIEPWAAAFGVALETHSEGRVTAATLGENGVAVVAQKELSRIAADVKRSRTVVLQSSPENYEIPPAANTALRAVVLPLDSTAIDAILHVEHGSDAVGSGDEVEGTKVPDDQISSVASQETRSILTAPRQALAGGDYDTAAKLLRHVRADVRSRGASDVLFRAILAAGRGDGERAVALVDEAEKRMGEH